VVTDTIYNLLDKPESVTTDIDTNIRATISTTYDGNENIHTLTYPNGLREERDYDIHNRLTTLRTIGDTTHTQVFTYDANGNRVTENKDGITTTYTYDGYDRVSTMTDALGTTTEQTYSPA
jgi:YD repeat-containing protein